jgi:hypothetical protein
MDAKEGCDSFEKGIWKKIVESTKATLKYFFFECKLEMNFNLKGEND